MAMSCVFVMISIVVYLSQCCYRCCPIDYTYCCDEGSICKKDAIIAFGSNIDSEYTYRTSKTSLECNITIFGDPSVGNEKECCYQNEALIGPPSITAITPIVNKIHCFDDIFAFIHHTTDVHFYQLTTDTLYNITYDNCDSDFDTTLTVYNSSGTIVSDPFCAIVEGFSDDCDAESLCPQNNREIYTMSYQLPNTYYIRIASYDLQYSGRYQLGVRCHGTYYPTNNPTNIPTQLQNPTSTPTSIPTNIPTNNPNPIPTVIPTQTPASLTRSPSTNIPTKKPTVNPTTLPTYIPTVIPSINPSNIPSTNPSFNPTIIPSINPSVSPTKLPTINPSILPSYTPSSQPTNHPTTVSTSTSMTPSPVLSVISTNSDILTSISDEVISSTSIRLEQNVDANESMDKQLIFAVIGTGIFVCIMSITVVLCCKLRKETQIQKLRQTQMVVASDTNSSARVMVLKQKSIEPVSPSSDYMDTGLNDNDVDVLEEINKETVGNDKYKANNLNKINYAYSNDSSDSVLDDNCNLNDEQEVTITIKSPKSAKHIQQKTPRQIANLATDEFVISDDEDDVQTKGNTDIFYD